MTKLLFFATAVCCIYLSKAQWSMAKFQNMEEIILRSRHNLDQVLRYVKSERQKQFPGSTGAQLPAKARGMNMAQGIFFDEIERRMSTLENNTRILIRNMNICPDQMNRKYKKLGARC